MTQKVLMVCEAILSLEKSNLNSGAIEATVTSWGAREGADGRKFNYQPEGFMQWANEFSKTGKIDLDKFYWFLIISSKTFTA